MVCEAWSTRSTRPELVITSVFHSCERDGRKVIKMPLFFAFNHPFTPAGYLELPNPFSAYDFHSMLTPSTVMAAGNEGCLMGAFLGGSDISKLTNFNDGYSHLEPSIAVTTIDVPLLNTSFTVRITGVHLETQLNGIPCKQKPQFVEIRCPGLKCRACVGIIMSCDRTFDITTKHS